MALCAQTVLGSSGFILCSSSQAGDLLDEEGHFVLLDGARSVGVDGEHDRILLAARQLRRLQRQLVFRESTYPDEDYLNCDGSCINDADGDGVCDELEIAGCTDSGACNYDSAATDDDSSCEYLTCAGCTDDAACNYDDSAIIEDGSCTYPDAFYDCAGNCLNPSCHNYADGSTICEEYVVLGCTYEASCNYDMDANVEDGQCDFSCLLTGCTDDSAVNYDAAATADLSLIHI